VRGSHGVYFTTYPSVSLERKETHKQDKPVTAECKSDATFAMKGRHHRMTGNSIAIYGKKNVKSLS
jgi:hypothetical protein